MTARQLQLQFHASMAAVYSAANSNANVFDSHTRYICINYNCVVVLLVFSSFIVIYASFVTSTEPQLQAVHFQACAENIFI